MGVMTNKSEKAAFRKPIILFDAKCVLCSANAQFILKHDKLEQFMLASMQGEVGQKLYLEHGMDPKNPTTMIVIDGDKMRQDSDAVISIYETLGYPWRIVGLCRIIPTFLRDPVYRWIARNRYRIFGKREVCWVASEQYSSRVL